MIIPIPCIPFPREGEDSGKRGDAPLEHPQIKSLKYMKPEPLLKALTAAGIGSRRRMADAIKYERVTVNDQVITDFRHPVDTAKDKIALDGRKLNLKPERTITLMLHKPAGYISTLSDERGREKVTDIHHHANIGRVFQLRGERRTVDHLETGAKEVMAHERKRTHVG